MACFYLKEHQHKGIEYITALIMGGHWRTHRRMSADFIFFDHDIGAHGAGWRAGLEQAYEMGKPTFIYPHSARPNVMQDTNPSWPYTRALFTIGEGHKEVLQTIHYPCPIEVTGWTYSPILDFVPVTPEENIKVLFAPIHPNRNGFLDELDKECNASAFDILIDTPGIEITVRHIQSLENNGLYYDDSVRYVEGIPDGTTKEIEEADVIIGSYTLAYIAVAMGKPLIMMAEKMRPHSGNMKGMVRFSKNWEAYRDIMRYPFEIEDCTDGSDFLEMADAVMAGQRSVESWKERFIGKPFDPQYFVQRVDAYL